MVKINERGEPIGVDKTAIDGSEVGAEEIIIDFEVVEIDGDGLGGDDVLDRPGKIQVFDTRGRGGFRGRWGEILWGRFFKKSQFHNGREPSFAEASEAEGKVTRVPSWSGL